MANYKIEWHENDIYNFKVEFNRIETYNKYVDNWLHDYYKYNYTNPYTYKLDWSVLDIPDLLDYNRVKRTINLLSNQANSIYQNLDILEYPNINRFSYINANDLEDRVFYNLRYVGGKQFSVNICGLSICGSQLNNLKMNIGG